MTSQPPRSTLSGRSSLPSARGSQPAAYSPQSSSRPAPRAGMSLDRRLDLLGWFLFLVIGFPTLLILLSTRQSGATGSWIGLLKSTFGWGL